MLHLPPRILIFDTEVTTWEGAAQRGWSGENEHRELVQIGAAIVETTGFNEEVALDCLVKPVINPKLSEYFVNLTGISQDAVDERGLPFSFVLGGFVEWAKGLDLYSFDSRVDGSRLFDKDVLEENCGLNGIMFPFAAERFHNVNMIFHGHGYNVKQSSAAPAVFGLEIPARPHAAINDVRGIIVALAELNRRLS